MVTLLSVLKAARNAPDAKIMGLAALLSSRIAGQVVDDAGQQLVEKVCKHAVRAGGKQTQYLVFSHRVKNSAAGADSRSDTMQLNLRKIMFYKGLYKFYPACSTLDSYLGRA